MNENPKSEQSMIIFINANEQVTKLKKITKKSEKRVSKTTHPQKSTNYYKKMTILQKMNDLCTK